MRTGISMVWGAAGVLLILGALGNTTKTPSATPTPRPEPNAQSYSQPLPPPSSDAVTWYGIANRSECKSILDASKIVGDGVATTPQQAHDMMVRSGVPVSPIRNYLSGRAYQYVVTIPGAEPTYMVFFPSFAECSMAPRAMNAALSN